jgi:hypothetical protein
MASSNDFELVTMDPSELDDYMGFTQVEFDNLMAKFEAQVNNLSNTLNDLSTPVTQ